MDDRTFEYQKPNAAQLADMNDLREVAENYAEALEDLLNDGADKTYCLRLLRTLAMWANVAIMRHADGAPRE